ncbi:MAG: TssQ family T6SS-associated lipoprotein [Rhodocyclales bacterium]|nr:TssQ family T6SS-associated lipoprotein [Rhodocyclales bacterium]
MPLIRHAALPALAALSLFVAGCATPPAADTAAAPATTPAAETKAAAAPAATPSKAQQELAAGVASYENGQHKNAARQLQAALDAGLESKAELAQAHKYLAFIHCVSRREKQCRDEFRKALDADPDFALTPAEAGHPTWGPVFRKLKAAPAAKPATKPAKTK